MVVSGSQTRVQPRFVQQGIYTPPRLWISGLFKRRELLWLLTLRDIKTRYTQTILGLYWAVVEPLLAALVFTLVFSVFVRIPTGDTPYILFLLSGLMPWTFFANGINSGAESIARNPSLITKIYFPREILPIGGVMARLFDLAISLGIFLGLALAFRHAPGSSLLLLPLAVVPHLALTLGIGLITAAGNVFYRDVGQLLAIILHLWMYLSPVIYPANLVPDSFLLIFHLNPMVGIIDAYRSALIGQPWPDGATFAYSVTASVLALAVGYLAFKKYERYFADVV